MNDFCDWCEEPADRKRNWFDQKDCDICESCDEKIEHREAVEWERDMGALERAGWMRAREEGVD